MTIARSDLTKRARTVDPKVAARAAKEGEDDEVLCVRAFARCRKMTVRKAFEWLVRICNGQTPGEFALYNLRITSTVEHDDDGYYYSACERCGRRHFAR